MTMTSTMALKTLVVLVVLAMVAMPTFGQWSDCSEECGGGTRTEPNLELTIDCHNYDCNFQATCPCGNTDLIFVMDESGSIGLNNFWIQKQFAVDVVDGSRYSDEAAAETTRVGLVTFSSGVTTEFDLDDGYTAADQSTSDLIWATEYSTGTTKTWLGLDTARQMLTQQGKDNNKWVVVVITDGKSDDTAATAQAAADLQAVGTAVYAIGITEQVDQDELAAIASDPDSVFMYYVTDFTGLANIINAVLNGTCCDSYEVCEVLGISEHCTASCGGGVTYIYEKCSYYNSYTDELMREEWNNATTTCCTEDCPLGAPTAINCTSCTYVDGIGFLQDPNDCQCYYMCEKRGDEYHIYDQQCCPGDLYWGQGVYSCVTPVPLDGCVVSNGTETCGAYTTNSPPASTTPAPCPYHQNPEYPPEFLYPDGSHAGYCPSGLIWNDQDCSCAWVTDPTCNNTALLYFPFRQTKDDITCTKAYSEINGDVLFTSAGIVDNATHYNGGFLSVPYMRNHFSYVQVYSFTVSTWFRRTYRFGERAGLVENGDCETDPSFALSINEQKQVVATVTTNLETKTNTLSIPHSEDRWVQAAFTYDGSYLRIYYNGVHHQPDVPLTGYIKSTDCPMKIGHRYDPDAPAEGAFYGDMDEIYVFEKTLTDAHIAQLYNNP